MLFWSAAAAPLAGLTLVWLRRLGQPVSYRGARWIMIVWAALLLIQLPLFVGAGDLRAMDQWWAEWAVIGALAIYALFPFSLTIWAVVRIARARMANPVAA